MDDRKNITLIVLLTTVFVLLFLGAMFFGIPVWRVWQQELEGKAILARAEQSRKVLIAQASAERDSAVLRAEAIKIVGAAAKEFPEYRQQEFIGSFAHALEQGKISQIIYVPTEANIPIIEAGAHRAGR